MKKDLNLIQINCKKKNRYEDVHERKKINDESCCAF